MAVCHNLLCGGKPAMNESDGSLGEYAMLESLHCKKCVIKHDYRLSVG